VRDATLRIVVVALAMASAAPSGALARNEQTAAAAPPQTVVIQKAPTDRSVEIPKEALATYFKEMDARTLQTLRLVEGGKYSVNIRRITNAETALVHEKTIDVWVVLEGAGTLTTGGTVQNGRIVGGQTHPLEAGDVEFIPANVAHGVSGVSGSITFLNIRWDNDWSSR
jgi:mannose-6-phosphate isomerase-like protein (cupin superfamily)